MPSRALTIAVCCVGPGLLGGCSEPGGCLLFAAPAIAIEVRDAATGDFIAGLVRGTLTDGVFEDSLKVIGGTGSDPVQATTLGGAYERPGVYAVHLVGTGYAAWDTANVRVTRDECHVGTARFTARLTPTAP